jgi:multidrug efflux pump
MFIILLAQFNSVYNAVLVLLAVVLSTTGVLIGMLVMDQTFSIIMTGTGIVALAGIVVNNNIVSDRHLPGIQPLHAADRGDHPHGGGAHPPRPSDHDHHDGGPRADDVRRLARFRQWRLHDQQPHRAVVDAAGHRGGLRPRHRDGADAGRDPLAAGAAGLVGTILGWIARGLARMGAARASRTAQDWALARAARQTRDPVIFWDEEPQPEVVEAPKNRPRKSTPGKVGHPKRLQKHVGEPAAATHAEPPELTEAQGPNNASEQDEASDSDSPKPPLRAASDPGGARAAQGARRFRAPPRPASFIFRKIRRRA